MKQVALIDDQPELLKLLGKQIEDGLALSLEEKIRIQTFRNAEDFLQKLGHGNTYDICFLDIEMPEMSGLELAARIREKNRSVILIFLTSYPQYAKDGYGVDALDYILKEELGERMEKLAEKLKHRLEKREKEIYTVVSDNYLVHIPIQEVYYICRDGKNAVFVMEQERKTVRKSLQRVKEELHSDQFVFAERGFLINLEQIEGIHKKTVQMKNGMEISIGRTHKQELMAKVHEYWRQDLLLQ